MFRKSSTYTVLAFAMAAVTTGCFETQKGQANASCASSYVGRQKVACEMGVTAAVDHAQKEDGKSVGKKYKDAMADCGRIEKPLITACVAGVNKFRAEISKSGSSDNDKMVAKKSKSSGRKLARKKKADAGRAIASAPPGASTPPVSPSAVK
ncbi:MAG: hypothetical protein HY075_03210 [Deltaproteobacteria bacterium]|nr:hypothetical protein [Deltaproteobacteria bacterium]